MPISYNQDNESLHPVSEHKNQELKTVRYVATSQGANTLIGAIWTA